MLKWSDDCIILELIELSREQDDGELHSYIVKAPVMPSMAFIGWATLKVLSLHSEHESMAPD